MKKKVIQTSGNMKEKFDKMEVKETIVSTGTTAFVSAKVIGEKVYGKGMELYVNIFYLFSSKEFRYNTISKA